MTTNVNLGFVAAAGGTVNAITATYSPAPTALVDKMLLWFRATGANTSTTPTFSPNGLTAKTIVKQGGTALVAGDIPAANAIMEVVYDATNTRWELLNPAGESSGWTDNGTNVTLTTPTDTVTIPSSLTVGGNATASGKITFLEDTDNGTNSIIVTAPSSIASDRTVTLPDANGTVMVYAGSSAATLIPVFSTGDRLIATTDFTFDTSTSGLTIQGGISIAKINISSKVINATAGDSLSDGGQTVATGRFRKDTTGTIFTLTNGLITPNSVIILTPANASIDATATSWTVLAGSGSATITFNAAPTANFDMNFLIIN